MSWSFQNNNSNNMNTSNNDLYSNNESSISFYDYEKEHKKKVISNIIELNDFDKEKLINKILENVDKQKKEELETLSFGDLWHLLITDRVNKYSKSFSDAEYEINIDKIFRRSTLYTNLNNQYGGSSNEIFLPADLKLTIETIMENITSLFKSCKQYKSNTNKGLIDTFNNFKKFYITHNIELVEEINFLKDLNDESILDIYRNNPNKEDFNPTQYELESDLDISDKITIFIINHNGIVKVIGLFLHESNNNKKTFYVLFSNNYDNLNLNSNLSELLFDVNSNCPEEIKQFHNSYTLSVKNLNMVLNNLKFVNPLFDNSNSNSNSNNNSNNNNMIEDNVSNLEVSTFESPTTIDNNPYIIYLQFYEKNAPTNYTFASYDFEKSYYLNYDYNKKIINKTSIFKFINNLLMEMYKDSKYLSIIINKIYLQRPNIEVIEELKNNEYVIVVYKNMDNSFTYCSLLQYKEVLQSFEKVFQYEVKDYDIKNIVELILNYNGNKNQLEGTRLKVNISDYSFFSSINYKQDKLRYLSFISTPTIKHNNYQFSLSNTYNRRNFKMLKFNNTFEDIKSKRDYFYMKQYFERLFNVSNLDNVEDLNVFKDLIKKDLVIKEKFKDIPIINVEYYGYDNSGNKDTGIDEGGIRPGFFENLGNEVCNTFLSNLYRKSNELDIEGLITEYKNIGTNHPSNYDNLSQCIYLDESQCRKAQESNRKDDCYFDEKSKKCDNVNLEVPLFITKNSEKYNSFCRYNIPIEDSYKLGGALITKMLLTDNGLVLNDFNKVPRISTPRFNLSFYLINRFMNNHYLDWVDIFACLYLDNKDKYLEIVGDKCSLLNEKKIVYSLKKDLKGVDVSKLQRFSLSSYSCTKYESILGGKDGCDGGFEMKIESKYFLSQLYLAILEEYESDCLKEYFYFVKGMNLVITKKEIEKYINKNKPINQGFIYKLFFGKQTTLNELLDIELIDNPDGVDKMFYNYKTYIHNLFTIDESEISFELFDNNNKPLNYINGKNIINLFRETNKSLYKKKINGLDIIAIYRLKENLNKIINIDKKGNLLEPILIISQGPDPDNVYKLIRKNILKIDQNINLENNSLTEEDEFKYNSILFGGKYEQENFGYALPNLKYNNTLEQENKIKKLLQFWTSQKVIPNKPKLSINVIKNSNRFPSAHTCYNQLDIPAYNSFEIFKNKLNQSLNSMERNEAFVETYDNNNNNMYGGNIKNKNKSKKNKNKSKKNKNKSKKKKSKKYSLKRKKYYIKKKIT